VWYYYLMNNISVRLKKRREELGLSKTAIAKAADCSVTMVAKWESGVGMGLEYAARVSKKLNVSLEWLYSGEGFVGEITNDNRIPIVGNTQAGPNKEWFDFGYEPGLSDEYVNFPCSSKRLYALKVIGDSMTPRILEGEAVIIDPDSKPATGEEVVIRMEDGSVMVKTLAAIRDGKVFLDSYNQVYSRIVYEMKNVKFMHSVIGVARSSRINLAY